MKRRDWLLAFVITVELVAGGYWVLRRWTLPSPPLPDLTTIEPYAAEEIVAFQRRCGSAEDWRRLGEMYMAFGFFTESEACHRRAAELSPDNAELIFQWAFSLERLGWLESANEQYERAAQSQTALADEALYFIGRNLLRFEKVNEARTAFTQAQRLPAARHELARLEAREGKFAEAEKIVRDMVRSYWGAVQPPFLGYRIMRAQNQLKMALAFSDRAASNRGRLPNPFDRPWLRLKSAHDAIGLSAQLHRIEKDLSDGKLSRWEPELNTAFRKNWTPSVADLLAETHLQKRDPEQALQILKDAQERAGPSAHLAQRLGETYEELGDMRNAVECFRRAVRLGWVAETKDAHYKIHLHLEKSGANIEAKKHLAHALFGVGLELFWRKAVVMEAAVAFERAVKIDPALADAWYFLGEARRLVNEHDAARTAFERCLTLRPHFGMAKVKLNDPRQFFKEK
ncbi:MAG: tetratricopeptide repeat protein [Gemmataceae bacterium]|nr:tetratricopeptide repeat protein [Gemmataceae bacterium]MCI0737642.1 tetratricopeptide repeat protein [Gemmataceae bacterium]